MEIDSLERGTGQLGYAEYSIYSHGMNEKYNPSAMA